MNGPIRGGNMPDAATSEPQVESPASSITNVSGGVNIGAQSSVVVSISGTVVGRDYIGYTAEQVSRLLTQISATFQPRPFDGRCPYLGYHIPHDIRQQRAASV